MAKFNAAQARAKRPCPLWVDAFQRDTQHLQADEVGAYMLILMAMWTRETCDFPDDDPRLARVSRVSVRLWKSRIGPIIREFLVSENGALFSKRLREEATYTERHCKAQSDRKVGEKSGKLLKTHKPTLTTDKPSDITADTTVDQPTQQPNNPTEEESKASSSKEADFYLKYLAVHPCPVETKRGEENFAELVRSGVDPETIIASAAAYADKAKRFSNQSFVQQSDNFLDPERGKWKAHIPKQIKAPTAEDRRAVAEKFMQSPIPAVREQGKKMMQAIQ